jgi:selenocysteine lyase/cysteine desulfurase
LLDFQVDCQAQFALLFAGRLEIRARFPALGRVHEGRAVAYFDGPGGTQVPADVAEAMRDYLLRHNANTGWAYPTSAETDAMLAAAREASADYLTEVRYPFAR